MILMNGVTWSPSTRIHLYRIGRSESSVALLALHCHSLFASSSGAKISRNRENSQDLAALSAMVTYQNQLSTEVRDSF